MLGSKPLASLSSGLLARKGQAKPAMRSQGFGGFASQLGNPSSLEDLGWNDMGTAEAAPSPTPLFTPAAPPVVLVTPPSPPSPEPIVRAPEPEPAPTPVPPVVAMREALAEELGADSEPEPVAATPEPLAVAKPISLATAARIGRESAKQTKTGKAAFTLRLDGERHLRLRLASALANRSAQQLVTDAVDAFLTGMPEIETLVAQLPEPQRARRQRSTR